MYYDKIIKYDKQAARAMRAARWLRYAIVAAMLIVLAINAYVWWVGLGDRSVGRIRIEAYLPGVLRGHRHVGLATQAAMSLTLLYGLFRLTRLMRLFEAGRFFDGDAVLHLRAFAFTVFLSVVLDVLLPPLALLGLRLTGFGGVQAVELSLNGFDLWNLLIAGLFFVITWIMAEARRLAEDNARIV